MWPDPRLAGQPASDAPEWVFSPGDRCPAAQGLRSADPCFHHQACQNSSGRSGDTPLGVAEGGGRTGLQLQARCAPSCSGRKKEVESDRWESIPGQLTSTLRASVSLSAQMRSYYPLRGAPHTGIGGRGDTWAMLMYAFLPSGSPGLA